MTGNRFVLTLVLIFVAAIAVAQDYISPVKSDLVPPTPQSTKFVEYQAPQPSMLNGNLSTQALSYNAEGVLIRKRNTPRGGTSTHLDYAGDRIFEGDSLVYSYFPGGYFDGEGAVHYMHADYQGNISMVTDSAGYIEQHNGYYPYGEPWREPTGQPRLYGGKERERFMALNYYDFHARQLNSATALWNAPDAHALKYTNTSPYVYCAANPILFVDPTGKDIVILLADGPPGHLAMLIQNEQGKWQYYSVNGNNVYLSGKFSGGRTSNDVGVGNWDSPMDFLNSSYNSKESENNKIDGNINGYGYSEGYQIETTPKQDKIMRRSFEKTAQTEYKLISNNCATAVQKAMFDAKIPVASSEYCTTVVPANIKLGESSFKVVTINFRTLPKFAFKSIIKYNPGGKHLKK